MRSPERHEGSAARAPKRLLRTVRRVVGSLGVVLVLLIVAAAVISRTMGFRRFATSLIADAVVKATGRQLTVGKAPVLRLGLVPAVVAEEIVLSNAPWGSRREMARARRIELQVRLLPLLGGRIVIERLVIVGLEVFLETDARGAGNWEFTPAVPAPQPSTRAGPPSLLSRLDVDEVLITDSCLVLHDRASAKQTRIGVDRLRLARDGLAPGNLDADLKATFNGVPISLSGTLGGLATLVFSTEPFPVNVVVTTEGATVTAEGRIGKVWALEGVDVGVRAEVTDPAALGRALGVRLPGRGPWRVEGRVRDMGAGYSFDAMRVALGGSELTGSMEVGGEAGATLRLAGSGIELAPLLAALGVKTGVSGRVGEFAADVRTSGGVPREWVSQLAGKVRVVRGSVVVGGGMRIEVQRAVLTQSGGGLGVEAAGSVGGVPLRVSGTVGSVEGLVFGGEPFPVKGVVETDGAAVVVEGQVGGAGTSLRLGGSGIELAPLLAALGVKSDLSGRVGEFAADVGTSGRIPRDWVVNLAGQAHVAQGSVVVGGGTRIEVERAVLKQGEGGLGVEAAGSVEGVPLTVSGTVGSVEGLAFGGASLPVKVAATTSGARATVEGVVSRVWEMKGVDVGVGVEVADPVAMGRELGVGLPGGGPWRVEGRIKDIEGGYVLDPMRVTVGGNALAGSLQVGGMAGTSLRLAGEGIEVGPLLAVFGVKPGVSGRVGGFGADVQTRGRTPAEWVRNVRGQVQVTQGSVVVGGGTRVEVERGVLTQGEGGLGVEAVGSVGGVPLSVSGKVGSVEGLAFGGVPVPLKVAVTTSGARASVEGTIGRVWELKGVDVGVAAEVADPAALGQVLGARLPGGGPWRVEGRVKDVESGYALDPILVAAGGSTLTGRVAVNLGVERPRVVAALTAPLLDLTALAGSAAPVTEQKAEPTDATRAGGVFSTTPLPLAGLAAADAQMSLALDRLALWEHADIGGVSVKALLADGRLTVEPIELRMPGGTLRGSVRLDATGDVSATLTGSGIDLGALVTILGGKAKATGGSTDVRVDLRSKGRSLREWAANLGGKVRIVVGPGRLDGEELDLGLGVMKKILTLINPFHEKDKFTELRCAVVNVSVDGGVVDLANPIVFVTTKLSAVASGTVDLGREVLDLSVYTKAALSLSAGVSNFAGIVKVGGPLSKPSFSLAAKGAATTSLSVGAAVATGGLSLIGENLVNKIVSKASCKEALAGPTPAPGGVGVPGGQ